MLARRWSRSWMVPSPGLVTVCVCPTTAAKALLLSSTVADSALGHALRYTGLLALYILGSRSKPLFSVTRCPLLAMSATLASNTKSAWHEGEQGGGGSRAAESLCARESVPETSTTARSTTHRAGDRGRQCLHPPQCSRPHGCPCTAERGMRAGRRSGQKSLQRAARQRTTRHGSRGGKRREGD